jgi:hypothetical protein
MKAFTDSVDKSIEIELITWDTVMKVLGPPGFLKMAKEAEPLVKLLQYFSSCDNLKNNLEEGEVNVELSNLYLSPETLNEYMNSSIVLKHVLEYAHDRNCITKMEIATTLCNEDKIYDEEIQMILSSINHYQSLFQHLLRMFKDCDDLWCFENKLKKLFGSISSESTTTNITILELLHTIFMLLKDTNATVSSSSPRFAIEYVMLLMGLTDNILKSEDSSFGLKAHFLISYFPLSSSEDALRFLERYINYCIISIFY